ncbi:response regulator [Alkalimonas mucilaginosa]|uniref:Response regulator n=1 Tax=Alkalimonas mucilaginosa TaxID=3057676 RepID=A0ABU7JK96_9GAMM|nr:response regulator [Alkalimonas sp. MEB004]MEE2026109.1 response regulator [Alkalimonas sp. MEB004]
MKILIAEDNATKANQIRELLLLQLKIDPADLTFTTNKEETLKILTTQEFNFLILDMSLPRYSSDLDDIKHLAGKDILIFMRHRRKLIPTVVVTQHDVFGHHNSQISLENLSSELMKDFSNFLFGVLTWDSSSEHWKDELVKSIESVE